VADSLVLGAGGVADGRTAAAVLAAGADGVVLGTRLVASSESVANEEYKRRLIEADGEDTVITHVYGPEFPTFNPLRVLNNQTISSWENRIDAIPKDRSGLESIGRTRFAGKDVDVKPFDSIIPLKETTGDFDQMPMLAGQGVGLVTEVEPVQNILEKIMNEAAQIVEGYNERKK